MAKEAKFDDIIKELEGIVEELENGDIDLEDSIEKYSKAMKLVKECDTKLKTIEDKVAKMVDNTGTLVEFKENE